jgi:hypothetical protein
MRHWLILSIRFVPSVRPELLHEPAVGTIPNILWLRFDSSSMNAHQLQNTKVGGPLKL